MPSNHFRDGRVARRRDLGGDRIGLALLPGFAEDRHDAGEHGIAVVVGDLAADLGEDGAVRFDDRIQIRVEPQLVAVQDRAVEYQLLVAVQHALHVDGYVELVEDLQLNPSPRHRDEGQRRDQRVVAALLGGVLAVVGRMLVLDGFGELTDLLPADLEVIGVPVVGSDDLFGDSHPAVFRSWW